jgi:hypothetical protein
MHILIFEQNGSGQHKSSGIIKYGHPDDTVETVIIDGKFLPDFIDEPEDFFDLDNLTADLVIDYLSHPDLSHYLMTRCHEANIPIIASGKKSELDYTPFTCCGLGHHPRLGRYGKRFGFPEYKVSVENEIITAIGVVRGAPCGATWKVVKEVIGHTIEEALFLLPRLVQYNCSANPARFDPVSGKSPVHYAGYIHRAALKKAIHNFNG